MANTPSATIALESQYHALRVSVVSAMGAHRNLSTLGRSPNPSRPAISATENPAWRSGTATVMER